MQTYESLVSLGSIVSPNKTLYDIVTHNLGNKLGIPKIKKVDAEKYDDLSEDQINRDVDISPRTIKMVKLAKKKR